MTGPTGAVETAIPATDMVVLHSDPGTGVVSVLLVQRADNGLWALPGGKMDVGETFVQTGVRELFEETGVRVRAVQCRPIGLYDNPDRDPRGRYIGYAFGVLLSGERPVPVPETGKMRRVEWMPVERTRFLDFHADHRDVLGDALAGTLVRRPWTV